MENEKEVEKPEWIGNFTEDIDEQDALISALEKIMSAFGGEGKNKKAVKETADKKKSKKSK